MLTDNIKYLVCAITGVILNTTSIVGQDILDTKYFSLMKGNTEKVVETHYTAKENFGEVETDEIMFKLHARLYRGNNNLKQLFVIGSYETYEYEFNSDGMVTKFSWDFDNNQKPYQYIRYFYHDSKLVAAKHFLIANYENDPNLDYNLDILEKGYLMTTGVTYTYDGSGNLITEEHTGTTLDCSPYEKYYESLDIVYEWLYRSYLYVCNSQNYRSNDMKETEYIKKVSIGKHRRSFEIKEESYVLSTKNIKYEYDHIGNWVKQTHFVYGKPFKVVERKITYR